MAELNMQPHNENKSLSPAKPLPCQNFQFIEVEKEKKHCSMLFVWRTDCVRHLHCHYRTKWRCRINNATLKCLDRRGTVKTALL